MNKKVFALAALAVLVTAAPSLAAVSFETARDSQTGVSASSANASRIAANEYSAPRDNSRDAYGWKNGANTG